MQHELLVETIMLVVQVSIAPANANINQDTSVLTDDDSKREREERRRCALCQDAALWDRSIDIKSASWDKSPRRIDSSEKPQERIWASPRVRGPRLRQGKATNFKRMQRNQGRS